MQTTEAKMFVSSLSNSAAKILIAFVLARSPLDVQELMSWTGISKRETIYTGLRLLNDRGMVEKQILAHGRTVWLPAADVFPGFIQMSEKRTPELQESTKRTSALVVVRESINPIKEDSSISLNSQMSEKRTPETISLNAGFPTVVKILAKTDLLFDGSVVISKGLEDCEPLDVLAWCAYAFSQKNKMTGPGGVVRNRLKDGERPPEWTKHRWRESLPEDFLEALGLIEYECEICHLQFPRRAELVEHTVAEHPTFAICETCSQKFPDLGALERHMEETHAPKETEWVPDGSVMVRTDGHMSADQAWQSVLGQLQMEMPRASFDTWVRDTKAVRYDGNALSIGVRNAYARDWLESRVQSSAELLLLGILGHEVTLEFVVAEEVQA